MSRVPQPREGALAADEWPALPVGAWRETYDTLHMWAQIVGKIRLSLTPLVNHWWNVPLYITSRGLGTSAMPYGSRDLEITFDFVDHNLVVTSSDGQRKTMPLVPQPVADFYHQLMELLRSMGADVRIWPMPVEVSNPISFPEDTQHAAYDRESARRVWKILLQSAQVFKQFRGEFIGKCSPVHFFWGSFDLAVTRFSGRRAPERPGADRITREAYSHECISHGFWPGGSWFGKEIAAPVYYSYTSPEPPGIRDQPIRPTVARFNPELSEFILTYDELRRAQSPRQMLMEFLQSTYEAGAKCAAWNRPELERKIG